MKVITITKLVLDNIIEVQLLIYEKIHIKFSTIEDCKKAMKILDDNSVWYWQNDDNALIIGECDKIIN